MSDSSSAKTRLNRRQILSAGFLVVGGALITACSSGGSASPTAAPPAQQAAPAPTQAAAPTTAAASAPAPTTAAASAPAPTATTAAQPAAQSQPATGSVTVTYWGHNHKPRVALDNQYIGDLKKSQPGITVDYTVVPQDYEVKLTAAMAAGTGPDMMNLTASYNMAFITKGFAGQVDPTPWNLPSSNAFDDRYIEGTLDGFKYQGKLYGIPSEVSNYSMFVNTEDAKTAGMSVSTTSGTQWTNFPKTWEEMVDVATKLTKKQGDNLTHRGFDFTYMTKQGRWTSPIHTWLGMAYQHGGVPFTDDLKQTLVDGEPFVQALQFQYDWIYTHKLGSPALMGSNQAFAQGENAMSLIGYWAFASIQTDYSKIYPVSAAAPFPQFQDAKQHSGANVYGYAWMVSPKGGADKVAGAWKVIRALSDHPANYLKDAGLMQPQKSLLDDPIYKSLTYVDVFLNDAKGTQYAIRHPNGIEITDALTRAMERTTQQKMAPKDSLAQAKKEVDAIIAKG